MKQPDSAPLSLESSLPWFLKTGKRLFATLFLIIAIPLSTTVYLEISQISYKLKKQAIYQNNLANQLVSQAIEEHYSGLINFVDSFASRPSLIQAVRKNDRSTMSSQLNQMIKENNFLDRVFILDKNGLLQFYAPPDAEIPQNDFSSEDWFQAVQKQQKAPIFRIYDNTNYAVTITAPIKDINGVVFAYLVNQETSSSFMIWLKKMHPSFVGSIALIDRQGHLIASNGSTPTGASDWLKDSFVKRAFETRRGQIEGFDPAQQKESLITYAVVEPVQWLVISSQPLETVLAPLSALKPTLLGLGLACCSAIFFLGLIWLNSIRRYSKALLQYNRAKEQNLAKLERLSKQRQLAEEAVRESNRLLEIKIQELERLNRIMMGREKRIIELKEELKTIRLKLDVDAGQPNE